MKINQSRISWGEGGVKQNLLRGDNEYFLELRMVVDGKPVAAPVIWNKNLV